MELLRTPCLNKGTAFTKEEREKLKIRGLLPTKIENIEEQTSRCLLQLRACKTDMAKWIFLHQLQTRNETLFYRLLVEHLVETMPIVYTPTVGKACLEFAHVFRCPQGMYLSYFDDKGEIAKILDNWTTTPEIIVVTDGSRILGLGDLGTNGMGIPIGKLSLYVAGAGFNPSRTLPVCLDVGTNNEELRTDPLYLGNRSKRLRGKEFDEFIDEFMKAVSSKWPHCVIQFEDFSNDVCFDILERYRQRYVCFNDDIQGTGAVVLSGFLNAVKLQGVPLLSQRILFLGAGSAATGVASYIYKTIKDITGGSDEDVKKCFYLVDSKGLVCSNRGDHHLEKHKLPFVRNDFEKDKIPVELLDIVKVVKPTALIGLSGQGGSFTEEVIRDISMHIERPIIFPLSNPTNKSECTAEQAYKWTNGKCIFASGSPFDPVELNGVTFHPGQGNNMYIFPGLGLGVSVSKAKIVSDGMILRASQVLADSLTKEDLQKGLIYPGLENIRDISKKIAIEVCIKAEKEGLAQMHPSQSSSWALEVENHIYYPNYPPTSKI